MSAPSAIPPREYGALYLYAVDLPEAALRALAPPARGDGGPPPLAGAVPDLLGSPALDPAQAELFDLRDLAGLGLSGYLMQGYDIPEARLAPHRAAFDALGGFVLLLRSEAAPEGALVSSPDEPLDRRRRGRIPAHPRSHDRCRAGRA